MAIVLTITWAFVFGLLGNIVSFMVFLAPLPTFYKIYKTKSTEGFQSIPYVVALFSAMLWMYYAFLKSNTTLLITINSVGCIIETAYLCFFLFYAPKKAKMETMKMILGLVVGGFGLIVLFAQFAVKTSNRARVVGWVCLVFALCVFVAPLFIVGRVIKTKSVEYMPLLLSVFLTLSAVMWFFYGLLLKDYNIAIPNVLGFGLGIVQIILYAIYRKGDKSKLPEIQIPKKILELEDQKLPKLTEEQIMGIVKLGTLLNLEKISVVSLPNDNGNDVEKDQKVIKLSMEPKTEIVV